MKRTLHLYILLVVWLLAACSQSIEATPTSEVDQVHVVLPTLKPQPGIRMGPLSLLTGVLELDGSCVRVKTMNNTRLLIIWDSDFKLEGNTIVNVQRMQQVSFGERVTLGGGDIPEGSELFMDLQVPLDKNCHGSYWHATGIAD